MAQPEQLITKIIDATNTQNQLSLDLVGTKYAAEVKVVGTDTTPINVVDTVANSLVPVPYDNIALTQATLTDTWVYKLAAVTKSTITITYTDATKAVISTIVKT